LLSGVRRARCASSAINATNHRQPAMPQDKQKKQQKLNQDYADFLVEYEAGRVQGTFLAWMHETGRNGIKIPLTRAERNGQTA